MEKLTTWRNLIKAIPADKLKSLEKHSQNWASCAVGEKLGFPCSTRHEMDDFLGKYDDHLKTLGIQFYNAIQDNQKTRAMSVLRQIEQYEISDELRSHIGEPLK